uniref:Major facilitator superfamily (MFS) profile domain-containing protein n=2 Tax=Daucus carota subsp. sativus TaxID=79200 RepID=A0A166GQD8_DAUCS|nr:PREDICTED: protein NRT1/ PTR FAMILY 4.5-like [Daucus carota subsp. sativus]
MEVGEAANKYLSPWNKNKEKGGFRAASFVYGFVFLDNIGFIANMVSMVLYFMLQMHFNLSGASTTLTNFMGSTFLLSVIGGFISDTFISRFHTCIIFGALEVMGLALITIQARFDKLHPDPCSVQESSCLKGGISVMFYGSLALLALGSGGVRGALPALGADQFDVNDPKSAKALATYFNYLILATSAGACIGVTFVVYLSMHVHWYWGFFVATVLSCTAFSFLYTGKAFYRLQVPEDSPLVKVVQVIVVAIKNRKLPLAENSAELYETNEKESGLSVYRRIPHTKQFSWLDKAAILRKESKQEPTASTGWTICTVTQVEEVKIITRMIPIIFSTIIMNTCLAQLQTFSVEQGFIMNRYIGSFQIEAPTIPVIPLLFMCILIPLYEFVFVPFARKITKHPTGITQLQRVGIGLVLSVLSMAIAGIVEVKRRKYALDHPGESISIFWLSFQFGIFGIADMFTLVGLLEFFYREAPIKMRSLSTSFTWISLSFGYFLSTIFVTMINSVTKKVTPSKKGWLHGQDLDTNNLDLFYWFLAILSCLNFVHYLYWANWYKYKTEQVMIEPLQAQESISTSAAYLIKKDDGKAQNE